MDIKGPNNPGLRPDGNTSSVKGREETSRTDAGTQGKASSPLLGQQDSVTLTGAAQAMTAASGSSGNAPFDEARVAELREAISNGNYPVDNEQLADRMIELENLLR